MSLFQFQVSANTIEPSHKLVKLFNSTCPYHQDIITQSGPKILSDISYIYNIYIWTHGPELLECLHQWLNNIISGIKFTKVFSEHSTEFLDTYVYQKMALYIQGPEVLECFHQWLNNIIPGIKFTKVFSEHGTEFLDTYVYQKMALHIQGLIVNHVMAIHFQSHPLATHPIQ